MTLSENNEFLGWKRKIIFFLLGQGVSLFGSSLVQYAIIWHITLTTKSGVMMTLATLCGFLPQILISVFAGVWADRHNRKLLIIGADGMIALATLLLAILFMLGHDNIWFLFVVMGIRSIGSGIQQPSVNALIPQLVPEDKLLRVNGINGSVQSLIMFISPAVSGALLTASTIENIFFIDVVTALLAILMLLTIQIPLHKKAMEIQKTGYFEDIKAGIAFAWGSLFIKNLLIFYGVFSFFIVPAAFLTPLMVTRTFGSEVWRLTFSEMAFFAGAMIGGVIVASWGGFKNRIYTVASSCISVGVLTVALGFSKMFWFYIVIMVLTGISVPFFNAPATVLLQEKVEQDMQGRVFSLVQIISSAAMPLGMVVFGPLADMIKIEILLVITGVFVTLVGFSMFYNKHLTTTNV